MEVAVVVRRAFVNDLPLSRVARSSTIRRRRDASAESVGGPSRAAPSRRTHWRIAVVVVRMRRQDAWSIACRLVATHRRIAVVVVPRRVRLSIIVGEEGEG